MLSIKNAFFGLLLFALTHSAQAFNPQSLANDARTQIGVTVSYDPVYRRIAFPMGDVPHNTGVCTDVVVRAYRKQGIDLQFLVNRDMKQAWSAYPKNWGLKSPDANIDHRRVPNLAAFFRRHGTRIPVSSRASDYLPGDIVTWLVSRKLPHIGIVSNRKAANGTPLVIHNIGSGTREEDILCPPNHRALPLRANEKNKAFQWAA